MSELVAAAVVFGVGLVVAGLVACVVWLAGLGWCIVVDVARGVGALLRGELDVGILPTDEVEVEP